jgi:WD40 repeat protein
LRAGLLRMVRLEIDGQPALRHVAQEDFGPGELDSLELFGTHRMVTFDRGSGATVAIAHEALLREWPRLAGWVDEAKDDLVALRRLELAAAEWQEEKRDPALVFSRSLTERYTQGLSSQAGKLEREFLAASEQRNADSERRRSRTRWAIMAGFGVAAVVAGVLAINARNDRAAAVEQREVAELRSLMNEVAAQATDKPDLALLLAVEAMRAASDPAGMGPMLKTLGGLPGFEPVSGQLPDSPIKLTERLFALDFGWKTESRCLTEPEPGRLFLATGADLQSQQLTIILDLNTGQTETRPSAVRCSFSVDPSQTLATGWDSLGRSFIFDLQTGENVRELPDVLAPQWLPDGRILAYSDSAGDGIRLVWVDPRTGDITETDTTARAFAPDPTGDLVLLSDGELWAEVLDGPRGQIIISPPPRTRVNRSLVSATDLSVVHDLGSVEQAPTKPVWSADGSLIGDVSVQGVLRVWDTATGEQVVSLPVAADAAVDSVAWVSFDATNSLVAVTRLAGEITIYNIANPDQLGTTVRSAGSTVGSVKTSSDPVHTSFLWENRLGVVYQDGHAEVIDLGANSLADRAIDVLAGIGTVQFGPDASAAVVSAPGGGEVIVDLSRGTTQDLLRDVDLVDHLGAWVSSAGDQVVMTADYQFTNLTSGAASAPLGPAPRFRPAGGIAPSGQVDVVNAWVLDSGSVTGPGVISVGAINLNSLTVESEPGVIELSVGTALVSALSDRIVLVTVAGTVFQYGYDGQPIGRRMNLSFAPSEVAAVAGSSKVLMRGADTFAMVDLDTNEILSSVRLDDVESAVRLDSDIAAIGRRGGDIELWSTAPLARIGTLVRAELRNRGGSIVGDGDGVWYSSGSRILRLAVSPEILTSTACRLAGRSLTAEEWSDFVSTSRPFEPACS